MAILKAYGVCLYVKYDESYKILLCQSIDNQIKWGFLKGTKRGNETPRKAAVREFFEESGLKIEKKFLENFFYQKNRKKDVGIFMCNAKNVKNYETFFEGDTLLQKYLCPENYAVQFFDIEHLPKIKEKQKILVKKVIATLVKEKELSLQTKINTN